MSDAAQSHRRQGTLGRLLPWTLLVFITTVTVATYLSFPPIASPRRDLPAYLAYGLGLILIPSCSLVGALIIAKRRRNRIGWLLIALGLIASLMVFASGYAQTNPPAADLLKIASDLGYVLTVSLFAGLILLFPNGQPLSKRWRRVLWFTTLWPPVLLLSALMLARDQLLDGSRGFTQVALLVMTIVTFMLVTSSALLRFARSRGTERQQIKWFAYGAAAGVLATVVGSAIPVWGAVLAILGLFGPLAGLTMALLRLRLYDVDFLISRTVVYGSLIAILAGLYAASIRLLNALFVGVTGLGSEEALVITTLILAAMLTPIKRWLEDVVERRYKVAPEAIAPLPGGTGSTDPAVLATVEQRLRAIVRDELKRSGTAS